jgi:putative membrane-bound dehydrogenase-like protein
LRSVDLKRLRAVMTATRIRYVCRSLLRIFIFAGCLVPVVEGSDPRPGSQRAPLAPELALKEFRIAPGLRVELVASEPDIQSPVEMAFDEDGRLWVVEMRDYPTGPHPGRPPEGRIVILEEDKHSGRFHLTKIFADALLYANGLMLWRGGAIVTCAPDILLLSDENGDGKADRRQALYQGFAAKNPQLRVNHPVLGIDNWIYVANGLSGGTVRAAANAGAPAVDLSAMDFRFDPIHGRYETETGVGEYGNTFDDWGRRFVCTNRNHLIPIVMPSRAIRRNPFLAPPEPKTDDQNAGGAARVYPLNSNFTTASHHAGTFTASCSVTVYRGDLLPAAYRGSVFTCDPTGGLVHQEELVPDGAGFRGRVVRAGVEFLASRDDWCRPVNLAHGPDGALYVVDMYRAVIEHPEYMPPALRNRPDLVLGKDRGRIWRIVPERTGTDPRQPRLSKARAAELVEHLKDPGVWWRTTAQRLLLERQDHGAVQPLRKLILASDDPLACAHAAWLLDALGALDADLVLQLLANAHPRVRDHGVQLSERWLNENPALFARLSALADDPDPRLRFQVALSLGACDDARILAPLARIALAGADDAWTRIAVASSVPNRAGALILTLCRMTPGLTGQVAAGRLRLLTELATLVGARRDTSEVAAVLGTLAAVSSPESVRWQIAGLLGLADGMGRRGTQLAEFLAGLPVRQNAAKDWAGTFLARAGPVAYDRAQPLPERLSAVRLLAHAPWSAARPALAILVQDDQEQQILLAAVRALAAYSNREAATLLTRGWPRYTPAVRREVTEVMLRQPARAGVFLDEIEAGRIKPTELDSERARQLTQHRRPEIRSRALALLKASLPADRKAALARYQAALKLGGDAARGKVVFQKNCATCHAIGGVGVVVGPDIRDVAGKNPETILNDVLDPNAALDYNYVNYAVSTKSGKLLTGIIAAETASSIVLKRAENQTDVVLRQDIDEIRSSGVSLMPEGLEKSITVAEMADLIAFLKRGRDQVQVGSGK